MKYRTILFLLLLTAGPMAYSQCPPNGTIIKVTNNSGNNTNGSLAWALDCLDNVGSTLTTVQFEIDGATEIKPSAAAPLSVGKAGATIEGANLGSGGAIVIDGSSPAGAPSDGLTIASPNVKVFDLTIQNFTSSAGGNGIKIIGNSPLVQGNTVTGNRIGIATVSSVFTFAINNNTVGTSAAPNTAGGILITGSPTAGTISDNEIAHNSGIGVNIVGGTVLITNNQIYCNSSSGITHPSPPDPPAISLATTQLVRGTAGAGHVIEVFIFSTAGCAGSPVQGKTYLGTVTTLATGIWTLPLVAGSVSPGTQVTATSTENGNNTSAFSPPATVADCSGFTASINQTDVSCNGGNNASASAIPFSSTFSYIWEHGPTTATISNLFAGTYTVTITNTNSCTASQSATVTEPNALTVTIAESNISCNGNNNGSAVATPAGGTPNYSYLWSNALTTNSISNLTPGTYTVTVTDGNACTTTQTVVIFEPGILTVSMGNISNASCFGRNNGSVSATPAGGTPVYSYLWSNGQTTPNASSLLAGTYTVTVTDMNNCTATRTASISQPTALSLSMMTTGENMPGSNDGTVKATPSGGTPNYAYLWNTGPTTAQISNLSAGTYSVTVTDQNSCTITNSATVGMGPNPGCMVLPVYAVLAPSQVCGNTPFTLEADDLYPNPVVQYVWFFPNGDSALTTLPSLTISANSTAFSGEYFVLRDSAGCRSAAVGGAPVTVLTLDNLFAGNDVVLCSATQVQLMANLPGSGVGSWVSLGAATIDAPAQNQTTARNLQPGPNKFIWRVSLSNCPQAATDTVEYFLENRPVAKDDHYTLQRTFDVAVMEVLLNDALGGLTDTLLVQLSSPAVGTLEQLQHRFRYTVAEDFRGTVSFEYAVCSPATVCNLPCDTATVTIEVQNLPTIPSGLVLQDNGMNGKFTIRGIEGFTRIEVTITDRWGDLVYQEKDYKKNGPWKGDFKGNGNYLPGGAYYYFIKAYDGDTLVGGTMTGVIHLFDKGDR